MTEERRRPDLTAWSTPDLLRGALRLYRRNAPAFIGVLIVAFAGTALIEGLSTLQGLTESSRAFLSLVSALVAGTGSLALARAILRRLHGQPASIGESYSFILERLSGYLGLLLLTVAIAVGVGIAGFIVSGLFVGIGLGPLGLPAMLAMGAVAVLALALLPFGFAEGLPVLSALERSYTLAQREWPALLLNVVLYMIPFGIGFWLLPPTPAGTALSMAISVLYTPFPLAFLGTIYLRALGAAADPGSTEGERT